VVIVGAGIAGSSLAYFLARAGVSDVVVLERETAPAYHASGRSAQTLLELDPIDTVQRLKMLGASFLRDTRDEFCASPLLTRAGAMRLFCGAAWADLESRASRLIDQGMRLELLTPAETARMVPVLDVDRFDGAAFLPDDGFIDVDALMRAYVDHAAALGVSFRFGFDVNAIETTAGRCSAVTGSSGAVEGRWIVNAAGAWAGELAARAGASAVELRPLRRSIATFETPPELDVARWPLVWSDADAVYFRPGFEGLLMCPMDQAPSEPCDAEPPDDVFGPAQGRLEALAPGLRLGGYRRRWAGLRTFAADGVPVVGADPDLDGFFWLAGQGGCGIETSPVLGAIAADLLTRDHTERFDARLLSPSRFVDAAGVASVEA